MFCDIRERSEATACYQRRKSLLAFLLKLSQHRSHRFRLTQLTAIKFRICLAADKANKLPLAWKWKNDVALSGSNEAL
jgi:hypothetical protein